MHRATAGQTLPLADLRAIADSDGDAALTPAVRELVAARAENTTAVTVRDWHHVTWNNCLVESSDTAGRHVYLPTYGHGDDADLALLDRHMTRTFARRQGVVHCIKKYLRRGD